MSTERKEGPYSRAARVLRELEDPIPEPKPRAKVTTKLEDDLLAEVSRAYSEGSR